jgi:hypothetical protein
MTKKKGIEKGFKGFNKGLICREFKYKVGETYKENNQIELCRGGFHFCKNPLDVLHYYPYKFEDTEFCKVEGSGEIKSDNNKTCCSEIAVKEKLKFTDLIELGIEYTNKKVNDILEKTKNAETEAVANSWYGTAVANREDSTAVANSWYGTAVANSKNSIACGFGRNNKCKGKTRAWLVLCEKDENNNILNMQTVKVDGKKIKANTYYKLVCNEIVKEG